MRFRARSRAPRPLRAPAPRWRRTAAAALVATVLGSAGCGAWERRYDVGAPLAEPSTLAVGDALRTAAPEALPAERWRAFEFTPGDAQLLVPLRYDAVAEGTVHVSNVPCKLVEVSGEPGRPFRLVVKSRSAMPRPGRASIVYPILYDLDGDVPTRAEQPAAVRDGTGALGGYFLEAAWTGVFDAEGRRRFLLAADPTKHAVSRARTPYAHGLWPAETVVEGTTLGRVEVRLERP